jgi:hypothetical protein
VAAYQRRARPILGDVHNGRQLLRALAYLNVPEAPNVKKNFFGAKKAWMHGKSRFLNSPNTKPLRENDWWKGELIAIFGRFPVVSVKNEMLLLGDRLEPAGTPVEELNWQQNFVDAHDRALAGAAWTRMAVIVPPLNSVRPGGGSRAILQFNSMFWAPPENMREVTAVSAHLFPTKTDEEDEEFIAEMEKIPPLTEEELHLAARNGRCLLWTKQIKNLRFRASQAVLPDEEEKKKQNKEEDKWLCSFYLGPIDKERKGPGCHMVVHDLEVLLRLHIQAYGMNLPKEDNVRTSQLNFNLLFRIWEEWKGGVGFPWTPRALSTLVHAAFDYRVDAFFGAYEKPSVGTYVSLIPQRAEHARWQTWADRVIRTISAGEGSAMNEQPDAKVVGPAATLERLKRARAIIDAAELKTELENWARDLSRADALALYGVAELIVKRKDEVADLTAAIAAEARAKLGSVLIDEPLRTDEDIVFDEKKARDAMVEVRSLDGKEVVGHREARPYSHPGKMELVGIDAELQAARDRLAQLESQGGPAPDEKALAAARAEVDRLNRAVRRMNEDVLHPDENMKRVGEIDKRVKELRSELARIQEGKAGTKEDEARIRNEMELLEREGNKIKTRQHRESKEPEESPYLVDDDIDRLKPKFSARFKEIAKRLIEEDRVIDGRLNTRHIDQLAMIVEAMHLRTHVGAHGEREIPAYETFQALTRAVPYWWRLARSDAANIDPEDEHTYSWTLLWDILRVLVAKEETATQLLGNHQALDSMVNETQQISKRAWPNYDRVINLTATVQGDAVEETANSAYLSAFFEGAADALFTVKDEIRRKMLMAATDIPPELGWKSSLDVFIKVCGDVLETAKLFNSIRKTKDVSVVLEELDAKNLNIDAVAQWVRTSSGFDEKAAADNGLLPRSHMMLTGLWRYTCEVRTACVLWRAAFPAVPDPEAQIAEFTRATSLLHQALVDAHGTLAQSHWLRHLDLQGPGSILTMHYRFAALGSWRWVLCERRVHDILTPLCDTWTPLKPLIKGMSADEKADVLSTWPKDVMHVNLLSLHKRRGCLPGAQFTWPPFEATETKMPDEQKYGVWHRWGLAFRQHLHAAVHSLWLAKRPRDLEGRLRLLTQMPQKPNRTLLVSELGMWLDGMQLPTNELSLAEAEFLKTIQPLNDDAPFIVFSSEVTGKLPVYRPDAELRGELQGTPPLDPFSVLRSEEATAEDALTAFLEDPLLSEDAKRAARAHLSERGKWWFWKFKRLAGMKAGSEPLRAGLQAGSEPLRASMQTGGRVRLLKF